MKTTTFGLAGAATLIPWVFRSRRSTFWTRLPVVVGGLGLLALLADRPRRVELPTVGDVLSGVGTAAGLYVAFQAGDRLARAILPSGEADIAEIYRLRAEAPTWRIALLLIAIIAPAEELFWRGFVQNRFMRRFGGPRGTIAAAATYGIVHLGSGNLTLAAAASVAGAGWGAQYLIQRRLSSLIISHALWDLWIFLIAPTTRTSVPEGR